MLRKEFFTAAVAVVIALVAVKVSAQSTDDNANRRLSILERLERLGRSLVEGDSQSRSRTNRQHDHSHTQRSDAHSTSRRQHSHSAGAPQPARAPRQVHSHRVNTPATNQRRSSRRTFQPDYRDTEETFASDDEDAWQTDAPDETTAETWVTDETDDDSSINEGISPTTDIGAPRRKQRSRIGSAAVRSRRVREDATAPPSQQPRSLQERLSAARRGSEREITSPRSAARRPSRTTSPSEFSRDTDVEQPSRRNGSTAGTLPGSTSLRNDRFGHASSGATPPTHKNFNPDNAKSSIRESENGTRGVRRAPAPRPGVSRYKTARSAPATSRRSPSAGQSRNDDVLFVRRSPSLGIETSGPRRIKIGRKALYQVTIYNRGEIDARDVVVTVKVPEWTQIAGADPSIGTAHTLVDPKEGQLVEWSLDELEADGREEIELSLVPNKSRPFDLTVRWAHAPEASQAMVEVQEPKLQLTLSGPDEVDYGEEVVYKLTLSNPGTGDAEDVVVRLLPTAPGATESASYDVGTIAAGEVKAVELELTAQQSGLLVIKAEATADGGLIAQVDEEVLIRRGHLDVEIVGPRLQYAGTVATYKIRVSNPGNAAAKNVEVTAMMPTGAEFVASHDGGQLAAEHGHVNWNLGSLGPGSEQILWLKCKLNAAGTNRPQVVAIGDGDLKDTGLAATEVETLADLVLDVHDARGPIRVGDEVNYELHIRNRGTKSAQAIQAVAFFSPGIEPAAVEGAPHRIATGQVLFDPIATLAAGDDVVLKIKAVALRAGNHIFRAEVRCKELGLVLAEEETTRFYDDRSDEYLAEREPSAPSESEPRRSPVYEAKRQDNQAPEGR